MKHLHMATLALNMTLVRSDVPPPVMVGIEIALKYIKLAEAELTAAAPSAHTAPHE